MKKLIPLLLLAFLITSCSKDKDPEPEVVKNNVLHSTKWQSSDYIAEAIFGGTCFKVLHFKDNETFEYYSTRNGSVRSYDDEGTYTLTDKAIQLNYKDDDGKAKTDNFILVNGGTIERSPKGTYLGTFVKQQ